MAAALLGVLEQPPEAPLVVPPSDWDRDDFLASHERLRAVWVSSGSSQLGHARVVDFRRIGRPGLEGERAVVFPIRTHPISPAAWVAARVTELVTHRSPYGPSREASLFGWPVCARCSALVAGVAVGAVVAVIRQPTAWWLPLAAPALTDAVLEKLLHRRLRRQRLIVANALAGVAVGGSLVMVSSERGVWALALVLGVAKAFTSVARMLRAWHVTPVERSLR